MIIRVVYYARQYIRLMIQEWMLGRYWFNVHAVVNQGETVEKNIRLKIGTCSEQIRKFAYLQQYVINCIE